MVKLVAVDPGEVTPRGSQQRVSYPILKDFLDSGIVLVRIDKKSLEAGQTVVTLKSALSYYIKTHELPVQMFVRNFDIYLQRLDVNDDGKTAAKLDLDKLLKARGRNGADEDDLEQIDPKSVPPLSSESPAARLAEEREHPPK